MTRRCRIHLIGLAGLSAGLIGMSAAPSFGGAAAGWTPSLAMALAVIGILAMIGAPVTRKDR
jgi:hypothetical protein